MHLNSGPDDLPWHISEMKVACRVLDDQIKALIDLKDILKQSRSINWQLNHDDARYDTDIINIPVISTQNPAQTPYALRKLNDVLEDRQNIRGRFLGFIDTLSRIEARKTQEASNSAIKDAIEEQIRCAEALNQQVADQRIAALATALNVFFLPLGFFAQV